MVVLLLALLGVWSFGGAARRPEAAPGPILDTLARLAAPVLILILEATATLSIGVTLAALFPGGRPRNDQGRL